MRRPSINALASLLFRFRWYVVAIWFVVLAGSAIFAPRILSITQGGGFDLPGSESWTAGNILQTEFASGYRSTVQIVYHHQGWQATDPQFQQQVEQSVNQVLTIPGTTSAVTYYGSGLSSLISPDGTATYAIITFSGSEDQIQPLVPDIRQQASKGVDLETHVIGGPAFDYDLERTSETDLRQAETYSLPVILIILVFVFGSLVAAVLPLVLGGASVALALSALFFLGHSVALSVFVLNMVTMIGLGLGVDYSLFIVNRFREELDACGDTLCAIRNTLSTAGRAVVFSGAAVVVGLAMLMLFTIVFMRSLGLGGMLVAALSVLVATTLLPALMSIIGERVNAARVIPQRFLRPGSGSRFWHSWSRWVMRHPILLLVVSMAFLLAVASPVRHMSAGSPGIDDLAKDSDSRVGVQLFTDKWGLGEASPIYVVMETHKVCGVFDGTFRQGLAQLDNQLKQDPRVARVDSIAELPLPAQVPCNLQQIAGLLKDDPQTAARLGSLVNPGGVGDTTIVRIVPAIEPSLPEVKNLVRELRATILPGNPDLQGTETLVGGGPGEAVDFTDYLARSFPYLLTAVLVITYFVLLLLFRSVLLPLKAIFMNLLSVSAAYGVMVLVFQDGWGASLLGFTPPGGILPFVPVILFSVLFGLSMDYEVFLLSRIKEEYRRTGDNEASVAYGLERTGRIITTAALIMIAVFGSFTLTQSIVVKEFGVGLAVSIFLDATIVRIIVVPATMKLLGDWNWYIPRWLARVLPDFGLKE